MIHDKHNSMFDRIKKVLWGKKKRFFAAARHFCTCRINDKLQWSFFFFIHLLEATKKNKLKKEKKILQETLKV